jgi:hypothetical protein
VGQSAVGLKNSGMIIACPMPMSGSQDSATPAMLMDWHEKSDEIAWIRVNVSPQISSYKAGWMASG